MESIGSRLEEIARVVHFSISRNQYLNSLKVLICSKKNESGVIESWEKDRKIVIKKEHLAAYVIK
jgi:hypothetical protein